MKAYTDYILQVTKQTTKIKLKKNLRVKFLWSVFRPYHCADCGKSYKDSASFKRHRLGHTGERPYTCANCSEAFIDSKALRRHREVVHPAESRNDGDLDSVGGDDNDDIDDNDSDDDGEVSVGRDVDGQHIGEVCDDEDDEEEEEEDERVTKCDENNKNASSTSAYSSFESNEERESESSWHESSAPSSQTRLRPGHRSFKKSLSESWSLRNRHSRSWKTSQVDDFFKNKTKTFLDVDRAEKRWKKHLQLQEGGRFLV